MRPKSNPSHPDRAKGHRPAWWSQVPFYEACFALGQLLDELEKAPSASDAAKSVKIRGLLPPIIHGFVLSKQLDRFESIMELRGAELVESLQSETARLIDGIENRMAFVFDHA